MALRKTWSNNILTPIPSSTSPTAVTGILHDHGYLITMSPIVTRYEKDSAAPGTTSDSNDKIHYTVHENISLIPGLWKKEIEFHCAFQNTDSGVVSWINAPMGLISQATYVVKQEGEGKEWTLNESIESSCNVALKAFVEKTMVQTRREMHQKILEKAREGNEEKGSPPKTTTATE